MELINSQFVHPSLRGGDGVKEGNEQKGVDGCIFILACCEFHFIREHEIYCNIQVITYPFFFATLFYAGFF